MTPRECQNFCENSEGCLGFMLISPNAYNREPFCMLKRKLRNGKNHKNGYIISGPSKCADPPSKLFDFYCVLYIKYFLLKLMGDGQKLKFGYHVKMVRGKDSDIVKIQNQLMEAKIAKVKM